MLLLLEMQFYFLYQISTELIAPTCDYHYVLGINTKIVKFHNVVDDFFVPRKDVYFVRESLNLSSIMAILLLIPTISLLHSRQCEARSSLLFIISSYKFIKRLLRASQGRLFGSSKNSTKINLSA